MNKRWIMPAETSEAPVFQEFPELHQAALQLLNQRGITDPEAARKFLKPNWETDTHDPFSFLHMREAVERVMKALHQGEHITIYGDYDADGVTGTAVVMQALREIEAGSWKLKNQKLESGIWKLEVGISEWSELASSFQHPASNVDYYIPHRDKEGYGLREQVISEFVRRGTQLLITVDCGIASAKEIALAKAQGIEAVVLDHHQFSDELPDAILVHPKLPGETYAYPHLAAVGVAWKFAAALLDLARSQGIQIKTGWEKWLLDLVAIATVTDMVPLSGENRTLEYFGLKVLNKTPRPGLLKLLAKAGLAPGKVTSESVAFAIGPRLNAAGRMDHASLALELLLAKDHAEAQALADRLEEHNKMRQKTTAKMMDEARLKCDTTVESNILILWSENWPPALVGLVAGKYLDQTGKPTVAIGKFGDRWVGSGRSISDYNITEAVALAGGSLLSHIGGHVQACGFSFENQETIMILMENLKKHAASSLTSQNLCPAIKIDAQLDLSDLSWNLMQSLDMFEPFGEGNQRPVFFTPHLTVTACDKVGSSMSHLRCLLTSASGVRQKFMGFNLAAASHWLKVGDCVDVVYHVGVNEWNGRREIQCKLVDVRKTEF